MHQRIIVLKHLFINGHKQIGLRHNADLVTANLLKTLEGIQWSGECSIKCVKVNKSLFKVIS
jgi:hypothetical protein